MTGLNILQVTDSADEALSLSRVLFTASYDVRSATISKSEELHDLLACNVYQLVIVHHEHCFPRSGEILAALRQDAPDLPCIIVADQIGKEAVELLKAGAYDYILKEDMARLGSAVEAALTVQQQRAGQCRAEKALRESEEKFSRTFHISPDSININRLKDGVYVDVNEGFTKILGYTREEVIGRSSVPGDLGVWVNVADRDRLKTELLSTGEVIGYEASFRHKGGRTVIGLMSARIFRLDGEDHILSFTRDITARKQAETRHEATLRLLHLCTQCDDTRELCRELVRFFQALTGCEAVALRLRDGADFPYYETRGFSPDFVKAESHLCPVDSTGEAVRDDAGLPVLACMCGQILRRRFDPVQNCFTEHGSFWTNSTSEWRASATESDCKAGLRFRCNDEGYESVALIPLRGKTEPIAIACTGECFEGSCATRRLSQPVLADFLPGTPDSI